MSRRKKEPDVRALLRFIADHESLGLTVEEFSGLTEERIRDMLRSLADADAPANKKKADAKAAPTQSALPLSASALVPQKRVVLFTDGASRGNPGPSGAGWVLSTPEGAVLAEGGAFLGRRTNNEAEYEAVIRGLRAAMAIGANEVALRADSELMIKQINGEYQVKNARIAVLHAAAREVLQNFRRFEAKHVRREQNSAADAMANHAIDRENDARSGSVG